MGKLRLNCPNCGKAVAVSETAKKARCPGCKKVMDVAAALAGDLDPSEELSTDQTASATEASAPAAEQGQAEVTEEHTEEQAEESGEASTSKRRSSRAKGKSVRKSKRRSGKKSRRAEAQEGDEAPESDSAPEGDAPRPPTFDLPAGAQPWMIIAGVGLIAAILLWLVANVNLIAAIGIVSALGLFVDSALMRITRVSPTAKGWGSMPMVWGLIGFVPVVGVVVYVLLRPKLIANSPQDIATPDMDEDDMSFEGKVRPPSIASAGAALVLALAIFGGIYYQLEPPMRVEVGPKFFPAKSMLGGQNPDSLYNSGKLYAVFRSTKAPLADFGELSFEVIKLGGEKTDPVASGPASVNFSRSKDRGWFSFEVRGHGSHRVLIKDVDGSVHATCDFKVSRKAGR